ncbi:MAG: VanZ family protein [Ardenticatenaceae bacterium]|nr:VanZ family protein [Ardenticatenaceae bacterium]MCB8988680.1 VanZ family protein [Ardenticatenaceae bacterium]
MKRTRQLKHGLEPEQLRRWSWLMTGFGLLVVLYTTLFPFDFFVRTGPSALEVLRGFDLTLTQGYVLADFPRNVLLFVPLGFGLAGLWAGDGRSWRTFFLVVLAGAGLSALMEVVQAAALLRFPSLADVLANGLGAAVGFGLFYLLGERWWGGVARVAERIRPFLRPSRFIPIYLLYLAGWLLVSVWLQQFTQFGNWDNHFPLIVGNEQTRDRPWHGVVRQFYVADRALSPAEVVRLFAGENATAVAGGALVANYDFTDPAAAQFPPLVEQGTAVVPLTADGVALSADHWLESEGAVTAVSDALAASSQLTLGLEAATGDVNQEGPARLVSISGDPYNRNITLGQEGPDLVLRLRMPLTGLNGRQPEFIIPNVFTDEQMHHIVITYDGTAVRLAVDSADNVYAIELLPAVTLLTKTFPQEVDQMRLSRGNVALFRLIFDLCLFWPWAAWLAYRRKVDLALLAGLVLPPLVWEWLLSRLIFGYGWHAGYVGMGVLVTAVGFIIFYGALNGRGVQTAR